MSGELLENLWIAVKIQFLESRWGTAGKDRGDSAKFRDFPEGQQHAKHVYKKVTKFSVGNGMMKADSPASIDAQPSVFFSQP